jgi:hypothetical protein
MARKRQQTAEAQAEVPEAAPAEPPAQTPLPAAEIPASQPEAERPQRQFNARRSWTERYTGPLQYEMFTHGKAIMFRFKLPTGKPDKSSGFASSLTQELSGRRLFRKQ